MADLQKGHSDRSMYQEKYPSIPTNNHLPISPPMAFTSFIAHEFVFDPTTWPRVQMDEDFLKLSVMFKAIKSVVRVPDIDPKHKIAILASKQEHCLVDLLHGWQDGRLPVHISCVISNHDRGPSTHVMRFLGRHGIPYHYLGTTKEDKREEEILDLVKDTDFLVLARYMQVLTDKFLKSYGKDIINIHHGLLPSFKGGNPSKQAFEAGVKLIGATTHFVTEELDEGPIIGQMQITYTRRIPFFRIIMESICHALVIWTNGCNLLSFLWDSCF